MLRRLRHLAIVAKTIMPTNIRSAALTESALRRNIVLRSRCTGKREAKVIEACSQLAPWCLTALRMIAFLTQRVVWSIKAVKPHPVSFPGGAMEKVIGPLMERCGQCRLISLMNC